MYRKNVASQYVGFTAINASTGAAMTGTTGFAAYRCIDGAAQASATGTVTDKGNGQYSFALSQADTNGNNISLLFTMTSMIPVEKTIITTAGDPTDSVRLGLSALPNAAAGASGGLGLLNAGLAIKADLDTIKTQAVTCAGGVTVPAATLASTTNITAATGVVLSGVTHTGATIPAVTTTTNLTNAPTAGDFTATMKTSVGTAVAASAVASVTGNVGGNVTGSVGSVVGAVGSVTGAVGSVTGNVGGNVVGSVGSISGVSFPTGFSTLTTATIATAVGDSFATAADSVQASPSPTTTAFAGSSSLSSTDSWYVGSVLMFTSGALDGLARKITSYTGATRLITVTSAWPAAPSAADTFRILGRID